MSVWAIGMAVAVNASSAADADSWTIVSVFSPSDERAAIAAIRAAGGRLVANPAAGTWIVHSYETGFARRLRRAGALGVFWTPPVALPGAGVCYPVPTGHTRPFSPAWSKPDV